MKQINIAKIEDIAYDISDLIGPDISYIRTKEEGQYMTGIEWCLFLSSGIISCFLIPLVRNVAKIMGKGIAENLLNKLNQNKKNINNKRVELKSTIDSNIHTTIINLNMYITSDLLKNNFDQGENQIVSILKENGFPQEKACALGKQIIEIMKHDFFKND